MVHKHLISTAIVFLATIPGALADAPPTLCGARGCDYLVRNHVGSYPSEKERSQWECYDAKSKMSISCAFIRGDKIRNYSDVYRKK
jgi:hypothetical protein